MYKVVPISAVWQSDSITHIDSFSVFFSTTVYHGILNTVPSAIHQDRIYPAECSSVPWMRLHTVFHGGRGNSQAHRQSPMAPFVPYPWQHLLLVALTVASLNGEKSCFTVVLIDAFLVISELSIFSCVPWLAVCFGGKKCLFRFTIHFLFPFLKAEHRRIYAFGLWCWRRLLRVPWTAKRSNQSIIEEINSEYSLEGLMPKLKLQCLGHLMWRADSLEKTPMLGKIEGRRRGQQRIRWLDGITDSMDMNLGKFQEMVKGRKAWHTALHGVTESDMSQRTTTLF